MNRIVCLRLLVLCIALVPLLQACGYRMVRQSDLPFREIEVDAIENFTVEPKLQDKLHRVMTEEFERYGVSVTPSAGRRISGRIHTFELTVLSEKKGIAVEYRIIIRADFTVTDLSGAERQLKQIDSPFFVTLTGSEALASFLGRKEVAEERALRDLAQRVIGSLIYR